MIDITTHETNLFEQIHFDRVVWHSMRFQTIFLTDMVYNYLTQAFQMIDLLILYNSY